MPTSLALGVVGIVASSIEITPRLIPRIFSKLLSTSSIVSVDMLIFGVLEVPSLAVPELSTADVSLVNWNRKISHLPIDVG